MHLTHEEIRNVFEYEDRGILRRVNGGKKDYPWRGAGLDRKYFSCKVKGKDVYLHRAIWFWHYGWVPNSLDHIDGNPSNNKIENLRPCTQTQNNYNMRRPSSNTSGVKGVRYCAGRAKPFRAEIRIAGKKHHIGYYETLEEAAIAYKDYATIVAGEFVRAV